MPDFLAKLIEDAKKRIQNGYYEIHEEFSHGPISLNRAIKSAQRNAIIAEIKPISPARGPLRPGIDPVRAAKQMEAGGAVALSVLTEPNNFGGSLGNLRHVRENTQLPLLMKDIIIHEKQVEAGRKTGADSILLIESTFSNYPIASLSRMIRCAHDYQLEVLLEVHNGEELARALDSEADIVGLNNRDLSTLKTEVTTTTRLMAGAGRDTDKVLISESGFESAEDIRKVKTARVDGYLIGSAIMLSDDLERKVREFVLA